MNLYRIFIASFIASILAFMVFITVYYNSIMQLIRFTGRNEGLHNDPFFMINQIFSPALIISGMVLGLSALLYKISGIVLVARNKRLQSGEQALWIIGFIMFGFITAIVFMALRNSRGLIAKGETEVYEGFEP